MVSALREEARRTGRGKATLRLSERLPRSGLRDNEEEAAIFSGVIERSTRLGASADDK